MHTSAKRRSGWRSRGEERLEQRIVLSSINLVGTDLRINGTDRSDEIRVFHQGSNIRVATRFEGGSWNYSTFRGSVVQSVRIFGNDGNDVLDNDVLRPSRIWGGRGSDIIEGSGLQDIINGDDGEDVIRGWGGNDVIYAGNGADVVRGDNGNDRIFGDDGYDRLFGGGGDDEIAGGLRLDIINGGAGSDIIRGDQDDDRIFAEGGNDTVDGNDGDDVIFATGGNNILRGGAGNDRIQGGTGKDVINGNGGDDVINGFAGDNTLLGEAGNDRLTGGTGRDILVGGTGNDDLAGRGGNDRYRYLAINNGQDIISDRGGDDTLDFSQMTVGVDVDLAGGILGMRSKDAGRTQSVSLTSGRFETVIGTDQADILLGTSRGETLHGRGGSDTLRGRGGDDTLDGGRGNDTYSYTGSFNGTDTIFDEEGIDDFYFYDLSHGMHIDLLGDSFNLGTFEHTRIHLDRPEIIENVTATKYDDIIHGSSLDNVISALDGDDKIFGRQGVDTIVGGDGDDRIEGREGNDFLYGGRGDDTFVYWDGANGHDEVWDESGNDWLDLSRMSTGALVDLQTNSGGLNGMRSSSDGGQHRAILRGHLPIENVVGTQYDDDIQGSEVANTLHGLGGHDHLKGRTGNDTLRGGTGQDWLRGDSGMDSLFGGRDNDHDTFDPGADPDVIYLWQNESHGSSFTSEDAGIYLLSSPESFTVPGGSKVYSRGAWLDNEIELVDMAVRRILDLTGNTTLLKKSDNSALDFWRHHRVDAGGSTPRATAYSGSGRVHFFDGTFTQSDLGVQRTVLHELGHFRDTNSEWNDINNYDVDRFRAISGWYQHKDDDGNIIADRDPGWTLSGDGEWFHYTSVSKDYVNGSDHFPDWARDYSKHNPREDFATSFAAYILAEEYNYRTSSVGFTENWVYGNTFAQGKMAAMQDLIAAIRRFG